MTGLELLAPAFGAFLSMLFNKLASKEFLDLFKKWKFDATLLPKLKFVLLTVSAVLSDAEEKQITNPSVKDWLDELKDAVYEAEDLLDEIATRKDLPSKTETKAPKKDYKDSFTKDVESKFKKIIERLESIAQQKDVLHLREGLGKKPPLRLPSTSLVDESEIFGREKDKRVILGYLLPNLQITKGISSNQVPADVKEVLVANDNELAANIPLVNESEDLSVNQNRVLPTETKQRSKPKGDKSSNINLGKRSKDWIKVGKWWNSSLRRSSNESMRMAREKEDLSANGNELAANKNENKVPNNGVQSSTKDVVQAVNENELAAYKNEVLNNESISMTHETQDLTANENVVVSSSTRDVAHKAMDEDQFQAAREDEMQAEEKKFATSGDENPVVAIVGMPGVGKTTLAQLLFNDKRVNGTFLPRIWVHVSEEFDILKITRTIYESLTYAQSHTAADLNTLQVRLQARLKKKKFLLILDDIWNENFIDWDVLLKPFKAANPQSRIVVTTRSSNVASAIRATHTYQLSCLSHEDCWSLFAKHAFHPRISYKSPAMKEIGEKIVKKCNGLPLAAKTLGALLYAKEDIDEWSSVLNSEIWDLPNEKNNILPALRLSYYQLPSHLKRCFAYCSIFPKGFQYEKEQLILLWMAEGLLLQPRSAKQSLDEGDEYFRDLLSKSFFQKSIHQDGQQYFVMHDLFSDLARSVAGEFCFKTEDGVLHQVPKRARYFSFTIGKFDISDKFDAFQNASHLRTFLPLKSLSSQGACFLSPSALTNMLQAFSRLRVLSLQDYKIIDLHESIGNLKYLRYLDLSGTQIRELKEYVCSLFNLETLLLSRCHSLTKLPEKTHKLINLQHLDISGTSVAEMPEEFGSLKNLHLLNAFVVGMNGSNISELKEFSDLRTLSILRLENATEEDALHGNLKEKKYLSKLVLHWSKFNYDKNASNVLNRLQPHKNLKKLNIENYGGTTFPNWLNNGSISTLVSLHLIGCGNCSSLPPLGQLSSLKELYIAKMRRVTKVDSEFFHNTFSSIEPFKSLEILKFEDMPVLSSFTVAEQLPCLEELHLSNCPELIRNLPKHLPSLKTLHISYCGKLKLEFLQDCTEHWYKTLKSLEIKVSCDSLISFPLAYFTKLENLQIRGCKNLKVVEMSKIHEFLRKLSIQDCPKLEFSPEISLPTPNLALLSISNCKNLASLPDQMQSLSSLRELTISRCPSLASFKEGNLPANLQLLSIENCTLFTPQVEWNLYKMASLKSFKIEGGGDDMKSFPKDRLLPVTLTSLQITDLQCLQSLNHSELRNLTCLETLKIYCCNNLKCISERLPLSLSHLEIFGCNSLIQRCKEGGEDWGKISHIPKIIIH